MNETWLQHYTYRGFGIDKVGHRLYGWQFVTDYYGPEAWKKTIMSEPESSPDELVRQAITLLDTVANQGFSLSRANYLEKHVVTMKTICQRLCGEHFSLQEEMRRCWDVDVIWTPEAEFEEALAIYEDVLPGTGSLPERLHAYEQRYCLPASRMHLLTRFVQQALAETQKRTRMFVELPEGEEVAFQLFTERDAEAYACYAGKYHSRMAIDPEAAAYHLPRLLDHIICHEAYPGHHVEAVLKELHLYRQQGYVEASVFLHVSPRCVISEGIAMHAHELIFQPGEAEQWMVAEIYSALHMEIDVPVLWQLRQAWELLEGLWGNAALLLEAGQSDTEVTHYFAKYQIRGETAAANLVSLLKKPLIGRYNLIYACGARMMRPWLKGAERQVQFRRFLTEQLVPSQLER